MDIYVLATGAILTLITSISITVVTYFLQMKREEKIRTWQLIDSQRNDQIAIRKKRFSEIEEWLNKIAAVASKTAFLELTLLSNLHVFDDEAELIKFLNTEPDKKNIQKYMKRKNTTWLVSKSKLEVMSKKYKEELSMVKILLDEFLTISEKMHLFPLSTSNTIFSEIEEYLDLVTSEIAKYQEMTKKIKDGVKINFKNEKKRVVKFRFLTSKIHGKIIEEIDKSLFSNESNRKLIMCS